MARDDWSDEAAGADHEGAGDSGQWVTERPYVLLRPVSVPHKPDVDPSDIHVGASPYLVGEVLRGIAECDVAAIDLETRGTDIADPSTKIVGVGAAWRRGTDVRAAYFDWRSMSLCARRYLYLMLTRAPAAIAHNVYFDGGWLWRESRRLGLEQHQIKWAYCTYGLLRQLANEGWPSQRWNLKSAQKELLRWRETNDRELRKWLVEHGYTTSPVSKKYSTSEAKDNGKA